MIKVSSTYQNQWLGLLAAYLKALASESSMKKVAVTVERSNPVATPSVRSYLIDLPPPPFFTPTIHHSLPPPPPPLGLSSQCPVLSTYDYHAMPTLVDFMK